MLFKRNKLTSTIIHCGYHKCMTVYFFNIFKKASRMLNAKLYITPKDNRFDSSLSPFLLISHDSQVTLTQFNNYYCTHIIRDPRDLIVSGYFYHLRTNEPWCALPNKHNTDLPENISYQQHLNSLGIEDGILYELNHVSGRMIEYMGRWNYANERVLELRFEKILGNELRWFREIFMWYKIDEKYISKLTKIAHDYSLDTLRKQRSHRPLEHVRPQSLRGDWRTYFTNKIKSEFKEKYGDILINLDYEKDNNW